MGRPVQFNHGYPPHPQQLAPKYGNQPPHSQPPVGYTYETFQTPGIAATAPSVGPNSKSVSMASTPRSRDYVTDSDTAMEDADPYNRAKYPTRPSHHSRPSAQFFPPEESSAARRYSPMNVLSPSMPYNPSPGKPQNSYAFPPAHSSSQRSPTRALNYSSPPLSYQSPRKSSCDFQVLCLADWFAAASRPPRLPPLQPTEMGPDHFYPPSAGSQLSPPFDTRSPRSGSLSGPAQQPVPGRGPVPKFQKIKSVNELQPHINAQPAYRRANPEGGFISVSNIAAVALPMLMRIATSSINILPPGHIPNMQSGFQLRIFKESQAGIDQTQQGRQERRLRQRGKRLYFIRE